MEKSEKDMKSNSAIKPAKHNKWVQLEEGLSMFTPDYMEDGRNQPEMQINKF